MIRPTFRWLFCLTALAFLALLGARDARAASNDKEVDALIEAVLTSDYASANYKQALDQLELGKQACKSAASCSPRVRARLYIAIGTVLAGGFKKIPEAKAAFATALEEDPTATLLDDYITPEVQQAFNEARGGTTASGGTEETAKKGSKGRALKRTFRGGGAAPKGWRSAEAYFYFNQAQGAEANRDWLDCVDYAQASLTAENRPSTRYILASCEERAGLWIEAYADYQTVARSGVADGSAQAKQRAQTLRDRIPKIVLRKPLKAEKLSVKMNDVEVPPGKLGGEIWINPGPRSIKATGKVDGVDMEFEQGVNASEFETTTVDIRLLPKGAKGNQEIMRCMLTAQKREDYAKCLGKGGTGDAAGGPALNIRAATEVSVYHDTDHVDVVSPAFLLGVESPTGGWGVTGSFLVDVVTAASADIVATASPRWREVRYVPAIGAHKKLGPADFAVKANLSHEPDYLATSVGGSFSIDLAQKRFTPNLGYEFSYDISGRAGTPYATFSRKLTRHSPAVSATFVIDKATVFAATGTFVFEDGDSSKPYRYVPLFKPSDVPAVPAGLSIQEVNKFRLPQRPLEQLPTNRQRYAVAGLLAHRFSSSTIRVEERLYMDSWGLKASTTEALFFIDLTERFRIWPKGRFNIQTGATFWRRAYPADLKDAPAKVVIPNLRTGDRELGPLLSATGGAGARLALGEKKNWSITVTGDAVYSRFLDHLYILDRLGIFGATTLEVDFE